jgi:hypothetical protein
VLEKEVKTGRVLYRKGGLTKPRILSSRYEVEI